MGDVFAYERGNVGKMSRLGIIVMVSGSIYIKNKHKIYIEAKHLRSLLKFVKHFLALYFSSSVTGASEWLKKLKIDQCVGLISAKAA